MTDTVITDDLARASAAMSGLLDRIGPDRWAARTPCDEWTVRDVVAHLVTLNLVFTAMLEDGPMPDRAADHLGDDPAGAWRRSAKALQAAAGRPGVLDRRQSSPLGEATGTERLRWRVTDLLTHAWDLVQATGIGVDLPDDLVRKALAFAQEQLPGQQRAGRFAEAREIDGDAPVLDRLAAFTGRTVPWTP